MIPKYLSIVSQGSLVLSCQCGLVVCELMVRSSVCVCVYVCVAQREVGLGGESMTLSSFCSHFEPSVSSKDCRCLLQTLRQKLEPPPLVHPIC